MPEKPRYPAEDHKIQAKREIIRKLLNSATESSPLAEALEDRELESMVIDWPDGNKEIIIQQN